jgi:hypothetical protein
MCGVESDKYLTYKGCLNRVFCCVDHQKKDWKTHPTRPYACTTPTGARSAGSGTGSRAVLGACNASTAARSTRRRPGRSTRPYATLYKELGLGTNTSPKVTAEVLSDHAQELMAGREVQMDLALRVIIELLSLTKYFGLHIEHVMCLWKMSTALIHLNNFDEAEIFARDAILTTPEMNCTTPRTRSCRLASSLRCFCMH